MKSEYTYKKHIRFKTILFCISAICLIAFLGIQNSIASKNNCNQDDRFKLIEECMNMVNEIRYSNPDSALKLCTKALQLSNKDDNRTGEIYSYLGVIHCDMGNFNQAIEYQEKALDIFTKTGNQKGIGMAHNDIGMNYRLLGNYPKALKNFQEFLTISNEIGFVQGIGQASNNIGMIYHHQEKYIKALSNYRTYLNTSLQINNMADYIIACNNIGEVYQIQQKYDSAKMYFTEGIAQAKKIHADRVHGYLLGNLSRLYSEQGQPAKALEIQTEALQIRQRLGDLDGESLSLGIMAEIYLELKDYNGAAKYAQNSLEIAKKTGSVLRMRDAFKYLYQASEYTKNYKKAFEYHKQFKKLNDSIFNKEKHKQVAELETRYETAKKEQQIDQLSQEKKLQEIKLQQQKLLIIAIVFGLGLFIALVIIIYSRYRIKNKLNQRLSKLNEQLVTSESKLKELNATKDRFFSIIAHDLKGPLFSFKNITGALKQNIRNIPANQAEHFLNEAHESAGSISDLLNNLLQWSLIQTKHIGIEPEEFNVAKLVDEITTLYKGQLLEKKLTISQTIGSQCIVNADKNMIATTFRNLIANAIKFTPKDGSITIKSVKNDGIYTFSISDTGIGIDKEDVNKLFRVDKKRNKIGNHNQSGTGLGLVLCKEYVEANHGKMWVESEPGKGSTFYFTLKAVN